MKFGHTLAVALAMQIFCTGAFAATIWGSTCMTPYGTYGKKLNCYSFWDSTAYQIWGYYVNTCEETGGDEDLDIDVSPILTNSSGSMTASLPKSCPEGTYLWLETLEKYRKSTGTYDSPPEVHSDLQTLSCGL